MQRDVFEVLSHHLLGKAVDPRARSSGVLLLKVPDLNEQALLDVLSPHAGRIERLDNPLGSLQISDSGSVRSSAMLSIVSPAANLAG